MIHLSLGRRPFSISLCALVIINQVWLVGQNKRKEVEQAQRQPSGSEAEEEAERKCLGGDHPEFICML